MNTLKQCPELLEYVKTHWVDLLVLLLVDRVGRENLSTATRAVLGEYELLKQRATDYYVCTPPQLIKDFMENKWDEVTLKHCSEKFAYIYIKHVTPDTVENVLRDFFYINIGGEWVERW